MPDTIALAPTHFLDAEIFSAGTWNGETFTEADLRELADNFDRLKAHLKPPLKFGHDEGQTLAGQADGDPALGWVDALRVQGQKLIATFAGVPEVVYQAIRQGRYRRVSAEIYFNLKHGGAALGKVLKAVALLGADLPAVTNLRDLTAYLTRHPPWEAEACRAFTGRFAAPLENPDQEHPMPDHDVTAALEAELADLRAYKARQEEDVLAQRQQQAQEAFRGARQTAAAFCEEQVRQGRLAPALRERLLREFDAQAHTFTAGAGLHVSWAAAQALLHRAAPLPLGQEAAFAASEPELVEGGDASAQLAGLANRKMVELNLTYSQAAQYVLKTRPDLARAYRDYTLNPSAGG